MLIDPDNPVVKLCAAEMQAEAENRFAAMNKHKQSCISWPMNTATNTATLSPAVSRQA